MPASGHDIPLYDPPGADEATMAVLKALPPAALADYCDAVRELSRLDQAIRVAVTRLEPYAEIHAYVAAVVDTLRAELEG